MRKVFAMVKNTERYENFESGTKIIFWILIHVRLYEKIRSDSG